MRRIILLVLLLAVGFWVVWPAFTGYRIHSALKAGDAAALGGKIDFDGVRASLRPAVSAEVEKRMTEALSKVGPGGAALGADIQKQLGPQIVDRALTTIVTAENMIRIHREGGALKDSVARIIKEHIGQQAGGLGGLLGGLGGGAAGKIGGGAGGALGDLAKGLGGGVFGDKPRSPVTDVTNAGPATAEGRPADPPKGDKGLGLANVKSFGFNSPFGMAIGIARDASAKDPDVVAELSFTGLDWKLTGLRPRL